MLKHHEVARLLPLQQNQKLSLQQQFQVDHQYLNQTVSFEGKQLHAHTHVQLQSRSHVHMHSNKYIYT